MSGRIKRAAVAIALATGVLVGGVGVQHAFAQTSSASPSATSSASGREGERELLDAAPVPEHGLGQREHLERLERNELFERIGNDGAGNPRVAESATRPRFTPWVGSGRNGMPERMWGLAAPVGPPGGGRRGRDHRADRREEAGVRR